MHAAIHLNRILMDLIEDFCQGKKKLGNRVCYNNRPTSKKSRMLIKAKALRNFLAALQEFATEIEIESVRK